MFAVSCKSISLLTLWYWLSLIWEQLDWAAQTPFSLNIMYYLKERHSLLPGKKVCVGDCTPQPQGVIFTSRFCDYTWKMSHNLSKVLFCLNEIFTVHHYCPTPTTWAKETGRSDWQRAKSPYRGPHGKAISIIPRPHCSCSGQCLNLTVDYHK